MRQAISEKRYGAIILDAYRLPEDVERDIEEYYVLQGPVFDSATVFWPVTGKQTRPELIYVPKSDDR